MIALKGRITFHTNKHRYEHKNKQWMLIFGYRQSCNTPGRAGDEINYHTWCSKGPTISNNKLSLLN